MYDPSKINTEILDVNFQNKINFSSDQYFEGKMFDQNYSIDSVEDQKNKKKGEENPKEENNFGNFLQENEEKKFEVPNLPSEKKRKSRFDKF